MGQACNSETTVGEEGPSQIHGGGTVSPGLQALSLCPCTSIVRIKKKVTLQS